MRRIIGKRNVDPGAKDSTGDTPLSWALGVLRFNQESQTSFKRFLQSIKVLVGAGVDLAQPINLREGLKDLVNLVDSYGRTPLHIIWNEGIPQDIQVALAEKFLQAGADPNAQDFNSRAPLSLAARVSNVDGVKLLLLQDVDIDDDDVWGETATTALPTLNPKHEEKTISILKLLEAAGADISKRKKGGVNMLMDAISLERWELAGVIIEILKQKKKDNSLLMQKDINEDTLLHRAAGNRKNGARAAKLVLENLRPEEIHGGFLEAKNVEGNNALDHAMGGLNRNYNAAAYLIDYYIGQFQKDKDDGTRQEAFVRRYNLLDEHIEIFEDLTLETYPRTFDLFVKDRHLLLSKALLAHSLKIVEDLRKSNMEWLLFNERIVLYSDEENWDILDWAYKKDQQKLIQECFPNICAQVDHKIRRQSWRDRFDLISGWDPKRTHEAIRLSESRLLIEIDENHESYPGDKTPVSAFGDRPVPPYVTGFYYEVNIISATYQSNSNISIGLAPERKSLEVMPGWRQCGGVSYGLCSDGRRYSPSLPLSAYTLYPYYFKLGTLLTFGVGDTVGCGYDQLHHTIFWTLNGENFGVAFDDVRDRLYPMIGGLGQWSVKTNFGTDPNVPFLWKGAENYQTIPDTV
ncbi:hypothetical protein ABW20_dc0106479 [Dactylellina cionopaga]|nr:hypothetical protein ABW20_dc0106479 [Dactylellina cionopaga]